MLLYRYNVVIDAACDGLIALLTIPAFFVACYMRAINRALSMSRHYVISLRKYIRLCARSDISLSLLYRELSVISKRYSFDDYDLFS